MSLQDYKVNRDKFLIDLTGSVGLGLSFPCVCCTHRKMKDSQEPCRTCDHNCNAVKDEPTPPVQTQNTPPCPTCKTPLAEAHNVGPMGADPVWKCYACGKWIHRQIGVPPPIRCDQSPDADPCSSCNGCGVISYNPNLNPNEFPGVALRTCARCNGTGESPDPDPDDLAGKAESRAGVPPYELRGPANH